MVSGNAPSFGALQRCSTLLETSNKIALISLDFARTARMCGGDEGVGDRWMRNQLKQQPKLF
jgi:hypothetical protein